MNDKEVNNARWGQYEIVMPELPESLVSECMSIIDNISSRKTDVVNWEERKELDEATQRSGKYLGLKEYGYDGEVADETAGATSDKEKELMSGMGDILREMEDLDGQ